MNLEFASVIISGVLGIFTLSSAPQFESAESVLKPLELRLHLQLREIDLISVSEHSNLGKYIKQYLERRHGFTTKCRRDSQFSISLFLRIQRDLIICIIKCLGWLAVVNQDPCSTWFWSESVHLSVTRFTSDRGKKAESREILESLKIQEIRSEEN